MKITFIIIVIALLLSACNEENSLMRDVEKIKDYTAFKPGSYWIYEWYVVSEDGHEMPRQRLDSVYIAADTLIKGKIYRIKKGTFLGSPRIEITCDSADYELSFPGNKVAFTLDPHHERIDTMYWHTGKPFAVFYTSISNLNAEIITPAGMFNAVEVEQRVEPEIDSIDVNYCHQYYSKNVGLVTNKLFTFHSKALWIQKLVRYKVQQ